VKCLKNKKGFKNSSQFFDISLYLNIKIRKLFNISDFPKPLAASAHILFIDLMASILKLFMRSSLKPIKKSLLVHLIRGDNSQQSRA